MAAGRSKLNPSKRRWKGSIRLGLHQLGVLAFVYSESREGGTAQKILQEFRGVLVSDFYAAYDAFPDEQQKCLIHGCWLLARRANNNRSSK
jgi:hypothetical protein